MTRKIEYLRHEQAELVSGGRRFVETGFAKERGVEHVVAVPEQPRCRFEIGA
mgnify:CR=1 FL=1